jgi:hypothetical protein
VIVWLIFGSSPGVDETRSHYTPNGYLSVFLHGQVESGPARVNLGNLPGYAFRLTARRADGTMLENRMVFAFKQKTEYFVNCEHPQNDSLAPEIESGCGQIMKSFRLAK